MNENDSSKFQERNKAFSSRQYKELEFITLKVLQDEKLLRQELIRILKINKEDR